MLTEWVEAYEAASDKDEVDPNRIKVLESALIRSQVKLHGHEMTCGPLDDECLKLIGEETPRYGYEYPHRWDLAAYRRGLKERTHERYFLGPD